MKHSRGCSVEILVLFSLYGLIAVLLTGLLMKQAALAAEPPTGYHQEIRPLLENYCVKCHNETKHKGGVNFAGIQDEKAALQQRKTWREAVLQLESREMPPEGEKDLSAAERERLSAWMKAAADYVNCDDPASRDPGPALIRRLSRAEYNLTIRDLLGIDFDSADAVGMPEEGVVKGYDNLAAALAVPPSLMEKYFSAADKILDIVFSQVLTNANLKVDGNRKKQAKQAYEKLCFVQPGKDVADRSAALQIVSRFVRRAYRRPPAEKEIARLIRIYDQVSTKEGSFPLALRAALKPVLVSPHFLFRIEQEASEDGLARRVNDYELAVRLSYFLWSSLPDDTLLDLAEQHQLSDGKVLDEQLKRMLADPKAKALTEQFAVQWLQINKLAAARPSTEFFPAFNSKLRKAMYDETILFFDDIRQKDSSVLSLLDADYTFLNKDLAVHYGIKNVTNAEMAKVALKLEDHRGGLLGMGSILALTSHTHRTSPTLRGKYILEVIFGTPPPPPPPNAGMLKEEKRKGKEPTSFRDQLARHAADPSCAGCHKKMDPLGFALDNYDAVGAWRVSSSDNPLDTSGLLPTGEKFNGVAELKQIILKKQDRFERNLVEQMLSYALGRELQDSDECTIRDIQARLVQEQHRFSALVNGIVKSYPFQNRKSSGAVNQAKN